MVLVDTSVWIDHFRNNRPDFAGLLSDAQVWMHPFISGELACGNLKDRTDVLSNIDEIPSIAMATDAEVRYLIDERRLWGRGLGWVDSHLLASALLKQSRFWTLDKRLESAAKDLDIALVTEH